MSPKKIAVFSPLTSEVFLCTEQPHPRDPRFLAYQRITDGLWLGIHPTGLLTFTVEVASFQAFTKLVGANYLLADRTAPRFGGNAYRLGYAEAVAFSGPVA